MIQDLLTSFFLLAGATFILIAAIGVVRLPDVYTRMHAVSKASSLGLGLILFAASVHFSIADVIFKSIATVLFIFLTTPVAAHLLSRAAYLKGGKIAPKTRVDELKDLYTSYAREDRELLREDSSLVRETEIEGR